MRLCRLLLVFLSLNLVILACSKKEETGKISASLMKSKTVSDSLLLSKTSRNLLATGSMVQSFTPESLKIPIYRVSLCEGSSSCHSVYTCTANTVEACSVEISDIEAFVDTLNASAEEFTDGESFDHIGVQFCKDGVADEIQHITLSGTVDIQGTTYATSSDDGLVEGDDAEEAAIDIKGGCASYYPLTEKVTVSKDKTKKVKLFFDASLFAYAGVEGGTDESEGYNDEACLGDSSAYVCAQVVTIVGTMDDEPTTEHYLVSNTESSEEAAPTASIVLYFAEDDSPIGGVQSAYRLSGSEVEWDRALDGGLSLQPTAVDGNTVAIGEPGGSISLANWFKNFERKTHTGTYTYSTSGGDADGEYSATKL